ncbi:MAG: flavodoxin family protein [Treponema sp.]|nr:flavodoxin family protein [Treponema sp.]
MKVIALNGSPHQDGVVAKGIAVMAAELEKEGIGVEIIHVGHLRVRGCVACGKCRDLRVCAFNDDPVNECAEKINHADGLILGSPVYYGSIAGAFKSFLDRLFFSGLSLKGKAAAVVVSLRRSGGINTFHQLNNYLNLSQALITPSVYWDVIHGNNAEEVLQDKEGLQIMEISGRNMAWLLKILDLGNKEIPPPPNVKRERTNFIH